MNSKFYRVQKGMNYIAVIDDHKLFSSGISLLLSDLKHEIKVETFVSIEEFIRNKSVDYSLIILDFYLPGSDFLETMNFLSEQEDLTIIVVSASPSPCDITIALSAGAKAFISKNVDPDELLKTVSSILDGVYTFSENDLIPNNQFEKFGLTPRHLDVLLVALKGYSNKEIAAYLDISPETVKTHLKNSFQRIGVQNRVEAIEFMRQYGVL